MATYLELYDLSLNAALLQRVTAAVTVACELIRVEDAATAYHAERVLWAKRALQNPDGMARQVLWVLLAQNRDLTVLQITGADDAAIQTAMNGALLLLV